jgi:hypothetical protein
MRAALDAWRYDVGLRGDGPALRGAMREVFAAEIVAERQLLSDAAVAAGLPADGLSTRPVPTAPGPPSDTDRIERPVEDVGATVSAASAPAFLVELPPTTTSPPPRRWPPVAAGLGLAAIVATLVVVGTTRTGDVVAPPTPVPVSTPSPPLPPPPLAKASPPAPAPTPPPSPATIVVETAEPAPPVARPRPPRPAPASPTTTTTPPPPPSPTAPRPRHPPPPPAVRVGARLTWLRAQCPTLACAGPVLAEEAGWLQLEPAPMAAFTARLHACVDECERH